MLSNNDIAAMREFCADCDDTFLGGDSGDGLDACVARGHRPLITDADMRWEICRRCHGSGELGGYPGVYTADDFAEDPDFAEDYMSYRRQCEDCHEHPGRVRVLTDEALERPAVRRWLDEIASSYAIQRAEMRHCY